MEQEQKTNTTPLHDWHIKAGANMANFGGFDMPLWYPSGIKSEHLSVLKSAGLFDTSHMDIITIKGAKSFDLLNYCFTKDIKQLKSGRCTYGAFLNSKGHCIDDAIVYKFSLTQYMICVNASMGKIIVEHLEQNTKTADIQINNLSQSVSKIDIQGPDSVKVLSCLLYKPEDVFQEMRYFSFRGELFQTDFFHDKVTLKNGTPVLLSRSGYTGEIGFEIYLNPEHSIDLWEQLLREGAQFNLTPCGLGARDSLRTGACLPLSHQDIGEFPFINTPWDFALPFDRTKKKFTKDFLGARALMQVKTNKYTYPFVGESFRKVTSSKADVLDETGDKIGKVLTCATDMGISWHNNSIISVNSKVNITTKIKGLSCGFIYTDKQLDINSRIVLTEGKRKINATIVQDIRPKRTASKKIENFL